MALTLSDLRTRLNLRTGDPDGNFLSSSERDMILNDAARKVASDLYRNGTALLTDRKKIQLEPGITEYALPDDLIGVQEVFWEDSSNRYEVEQRPLQSFQDIDRTGDRPIYFDVFGQTGEFVARTNPSTASSFGSSSLDDHSFLLSYSYSSDAGTSGWGSRDLRVGDIVYNLTDDSSGTISAVTTDTYQPRITVQLTGGERNRVRHGDDLLIERGQKTLPVLHIYPQPTDAITVEVVDSGSISGASTDVDLTIDSNMGSTDTPPFELYAIRLCGGVLAGSGSNDYYLVKEGSTSRAYRDYWRSSTSAQTIKPDRDITLDSDGAWTISFSSGAGTSADYEILKLKKTEGLTAYYARNPSRMDLSTDQLELPEIALEAALLHAEYEVHLKAEGGRNNLSAQAYALYEMELQKIQKFLRTRNIRGSRTVRNVMYGRSLRYG